MMPTETLPVPAREEVREEVQGLEPTLPAREQAKQVVATFIGQFESQAKGVVQPQEVSTAAHEYVVQHELSPEIHAHIDELVHVLLSETHENAQTVLEQGDEIEAEEFGPVERASDESGAGESAPDSRGSEAIAA